MAFTPIPAQNPADRGYDQSVLPKHLRDKAKQSDKAIALMQAGKDPMDPANWQEPPPAQQQNGANPPPAQQTPQEQAPQQAAPQQPPTRETPPTAPPAGQNAPSGEQQDWQQRYQSLEGMFRQQQRTIQGMEGELQQLRGALADAERNPPAAQSGQQLPAGQNGRVDITQLFSEEERADWGPEWTSAMQKIADGIAQPLQDRINQLEGTTSHISQREARSARQTMIDHLHSQQINFDELNTAPDFIEWLGHEDLGAGQPRKNLLQAAWDRNEGSRVEYFVRQFLREVRRAEPEAQPPKAPVSGRAPAPRGKGLEDIAAPGKGKSTEPPRTAGDAAQPETFTAKQYSEFHRDKALGRLKMTPEDIASWEKRLDDAYREGRIVSTPQE